MEEYGLSVTASSESLRNPWNMYLRSIRFTQSLTDTYVEEGWYAARVHSGVESFKVAHSI